MAIGRTTYFGKELLTLRRNRNIFSTRSAHSGPAHNGRNIVMNHIARALMTTISALLLAFTMLAAVPAQAAEFEPATVEPVTVEQPTTVEIIREPNPTTDATIDVGWTGYYIKFNRTETAKIGLSAASCAVLVSKFAWGIAKPLSAACGLMTALAGYHLGRGRCLTAGVTFWGQPSFGSWNC